MNVELAECEYLPTKHTANPSTAQHVPFKTNYLISTDLWPPNKVVMDKGPHSVLLPSF